MSAPFNWLWVKTIARPTASHIQMIEVSNDAAAPQKEGHKSFEKCKDLVQNQMSEKQ